MNVFKVGMKVYDQFVFPNKEGKVLRIDELGNYPVRVTFGNTHITWSYTRDGRYYSNMEPSLSTSPYSIEGFEQKAPAPEFHDALEWLDNNKDYQTVFEDEKTYPSEEIYEASEALRKLIILREYYNEGWQADWKKGNMETKFCLEICDNEFIKTTRVFNKCVITFKTEEIRDKFLEEQKELLEIAKPLL